MNKLLSRSFTRSIINSLNGIISLWPNKSLYVYLVILFLSTVNVARADPATLSGPLSIKDAVMMALDRNRGLEIVEKQRDEVRANADAAIGRLLPRIDASYSASRSDSPINVFSNKLLQKRFTSPDFALSRLNNPDTINNYHTDLSVTVPVYQGGALWAGKRAGDANTKNAEWQYRARWQTTILRVIETFSQLRESQAKRKAARQALAAARDHLADTRTLKRRGLTIASDVMDARSHTLEAGVALESASHIVASAQDQLHRLLGLSPGMPLSTSGAIELVLPDHSQDEWLEIATRNQPELQAARHRLDVARAHTDAAKSPFRPAVNLQAIEEWNSNIAVPRNANTTITAEVRFNLFSGGSDQALLHAAHAATAVRELELEDIAQTIHNQVLTTWRNLHEAKSRLVANKQVLQQTLESLRIRKLREQQGLERASDVLATQSRADYARAATIRARYALIIAKAHLLAAAGQLTPEVIR